jgi:hypothetical protein
MSDTMTDAELDAARALNVEIAERIMGWTWQAVNFYWNRGGEMYLVPPEGPSAVHNTTGGSWDYLNDDPMRRVLFDLPDWATDMEVAWPIVERLHARGLSLTVEAKPKAPHAICRAALEAAPRRADHSQEAAS